MDFPLYWADPDSSSFFFWIRTFYVPFIVLFVIPNAIYFSSLLFLSADVVSSLAKNIKTCVLRLSVDKVCFVLAAQGSLGMNIWCELTQVSAYKQISFTNSCQ